MKGYDNYMKKYNLDGITILNRIMDSNEYFRCGIATDGTCRNNDNMYKCQKMIELYSYLISHSELLEKLFSYDNVYEDVNVINNLHNMMCYQYVTPAQAIKFLTTKYDFI